MSQIPPQQAGDDRASRTTDLALSPAVLSPRWPRVAHEALIRSGRVPMHEARCGDPTIWQVGTFVRFVCLCIACLGLSACSLRGAPSYSIFGAFFPAWLLCAGIGLVSSVVLRVLVIALGFEEALPSPLLVYTAFAAGAALWLWLALFGEH
jgi:YtcA family